eukprot:CAMPEP_0179204418 /NCGR_PEP_ID=MMETSP0796-20121207/101903_1 /TAXON_ID=73915 /ORGANISM="Pyrodinium bahamense, Strain pbaha01" /LENGTH=105 /DNA_ID=CAMNT_0020909295 /DNA_START=178 /DNA_END=491 /DNA_ORIENTATION=-
MTSRTRSSEQLGGVQIPSARCPRARSPRWYSSRSPLTSVKFSRNVAVAIQNRPFKSLVQLSCADTAAAMSERQLRPFSAYVRSGSPLESRYRRPRPKTSRSVQEL